MTDTKAAEERLLGFAYGTEVSHIPALRLHAREVLQALTEERRKAQRYHDALISRHGGEPVALLQELDEERRKREEAEQDAAVLRRLAERAHRIVLSGSGEHYYSHAKQTLTWIAEARKAEK
jgi:hypothetical protein